MTERTFSIIKPDATRRNLTGKVNAVIEDAGLRIVAQRRIQMTEAQAKKFYEVHAERPFYGELVEFMTSAPVVVQVLQGDNAVARYREVMGATNPAQAADGTIRKLYAESVGENSVHGSDSRRTPDRDRPALHRRPDRRPITGTPPGVRLFRCGRPYHFSRERARSGFTDVRIQAQRGGLLENSNPSRWSGGGSKPARNARASSTSLRHGLLKRKPPKRAGEEAGRPSGAGQQRRGSARAEAPGPQGPQGSSEGRGPRQARSQVGATSGLTLLVRVGPASQLAGHVAIVALDQQFDGLAALFSGEGELLGYLDGR